jgi:hypothetical protein
VSDKECQKIIKAVIQRFLHGKPPYHFIHISTYTIYAFIADVVERPEIEWNFDVGGKIGRAGPLAICGVVLLFIAWTGPLLHVPFAYLRRLQLLSKRADKGEYVPDLWKKFIKGALKEWGDLNIVVSPSIFFLASNRNLMVHFKRCSLPSYLRM